MTETQITKSGSNYETSHPISYVTKTYPSGKIYEGQFQNNKPHGEGTMIYPNGFKYEGQFKDGKKHGVGIYTNIEDGSKKELKFDEDYMCSLINEVWMSEKDFPNN